MIALRKINKSFFNNQVLFDVDFTVLRGEIHALVGENGAGKSTLTKILSGLETPDSGVIELNGKPITHSSPGDAIIKGINHIHQELNIAHNLTVAQNMFMGFEKTIFGFIKDSHAMNTQAQQYLEKLGAEFCATDIAGSLSMGRQQQIEIAKAFVHNGIVIILDEPTSSLSEKESEKLFQILRTLKSEGVSIIYISHRMNEIYDLADRLTVLRDGRSIGTLEHKDITDEKVISMMVGRSLEQFYGKEPVQNSEKSLFIVHNITSDGMKKVSFFAKKGEVVGISGLIGAGRTKLARLIYGIDEKMSGSIWLNGNQLSINNPADAIAESIVYLPEDRKQQGLFLDMSCAINIAINKIEDYSHTRAIFKGICKHKEVMRMVKKNIVKYNIKLTNPNITSKSLSGGNQQKLLIARLLSIEPKVIIFDEPTRGVDVATKIEIYNLMHEMAQKGTFVIFISSDLPEIIGVAHRVLIMREGEITGELAGADITQEKIMKYATGLDHNYHFDIESLHYKDTA